MGGGNLNIPKPLTTSPPLSPPPPPPPPPPPQNGPMLYYGLVVVATAALVLAVYNLIIVRWCATQYHHRRSQHQTQLSLRTHYPTTTTMSSPPLSGVGSTMTIHLVSSFQYKKGGEKNKLDDDVSECSVCLSVFEEGEEVRKLPTCHHFFHASCIDMWLHSHIDCPLCRAPVVAPPPPLPPPPTT